MVTNVFIEKIEKLGSHCFVEKNLGGKSVEKIATRFAMGSSLSAMSVSFEWRIIMWRFVFNSWWKCLIWWYLFRLANFIRVDWWLCFRRFIWNTCLLEDLLSISETERFSPWVCLILGCANLVLWICPVQKIGEGFRFSVEQLIFRSWSLKTILKNMIWSRILEYIQYRGTLDRRYSVFVQQ